MLSYEISIWNRDTVHMDLLVLACEQLLWHPQQRRRRRATASARLLALDVQEAAIEDELSPALALRQPRIVDLDQPQLRLQTDIRVKPQQNIRNNAARHRVFAEALQ